MNNAGAASAMQTIPTALNVERNGATYNVHTVNTGLSHGEFLATTYFFED